VDVGSNQVSAVCVDHSGIQLGARELGAADNLFRLERGKIAQLQITP
jgi:hypothetical protein